MNNSAISTFDRARVAYIFLYDYNHDQSNPNLILTKLQWLKIICELFKKHLNEIEILNNDTLLFLSLNVDHIDSADKVIIYKPALTSLKNALSSDSILWEGFITKLIRPKYTPYRGGGYLVFEPFLEQIFGDWRKFKAKLVKSKFTGGLDKIKKVILKNIEPFYANNNMAFKIDNVDDSKFVDDWMVEHGTALVIK